MGHHETDTSNATKPVLVYDLAQIEENFVRSEPGHRVTVVIRKVLIRL
jgi:hypothetical protein